MTTTTATSRPWTPSDRDRLIYRWVKFDGHKQSWVADQLDLNQSTVSRIIDRYERWIAHGGPAQQGALSHDERRRAQRWLTIERNEWLLAAAMRLAGEMEHMSDTTKSTTKRNSSDPSREIEVRTENSIRDRTGTACRYLRLAFRINMEQEKLVAKDDLPALEPLTLDPNELSQAHSDARSGFQSQNSPFEKAHAEEPTSQICDLKSEICTPPPPLSLSPPPDPATHHSPASPMSAMHNPQPPASPLTPAPTITSLEIAPSKKPMVHAYALPQTPPEPTDQLKPILGATPNQPPPIRVLPLDLAASAHY